MLKRLIPIATLAALAMMAASPAMACGKRDHYCRQVKKITNHLNGAIPAVKSQVASLGPGPVYMQVGKGDDIFAFCTQGMPEHGWIGVNPATGQYHIPNYWTVNPQWIPHYVALCPIGIRGF